MALLHAVEMERKEETTNLHSSLESTEAALLSAQESIASLQADLLSKSDYEAIKWELKVLRSIEFDQQGDEGPSLIDESLEIRLKRKNEQLQNRIASVSAEKDQIECMLFACAACCALHFQLLEVVFFETSWAKCSKNHKCWFVGSRDSTKGINNSFGRGSQ